MLLVAHNLHAALAGTACNSNRVGDSITTGCGAFCKDTSSKSHCAMCKCRACDYCTPHVASEPAQPRVQAHCEAPRHEHHGKEVVPFVMWMSERTGSSWVMDLLNDHPEITMGGESAGCSASDPATQKECLDRLCGYFSAPVGAASTSCSSKATMVHARGRQCPAAVPRVRGFKQNLFSCIGSSPQASAASDLSRSRRNASNALETCLQTQWVAESHELYSSVGARIICSLRRNAFELAMSQYLLHHVVGQRCHASSAHTHLPTPSAATSMPRVIPCTCAEKPPPHVLQTLVRAIRMPKRAGPKRSAMACT